MVAHWDVTVRKQFVTRDRNKRIYVEITLGIFHVDCMAHTLSAL